MAEHRSGGGGNGADPPRADDPQGAATARHPDHVVDGSQRADDRRADDPGADDRRADDPGADAGQVRSVDGPTAEVGVGPDARSGSQAHGAPAEPTGAPGVDRARLLEVLRRGVVQPAGRLAYSSNATFLAEVCEGDDRVLAVYKPTRGERPLWDFPAGLHKREVAAYELSVALGWDLVPPTVLRGDEAPMGEGSLQAFVEADIDQHYFTLLEDEELHDQLRRACAFDIVANNTDRKGGHLLVDEHGHVWGIDNGLAFHAEFKLRTVIWDFAGEELPDELVDDLRRFHDAGLSEPLAALLDPFERDAVLGRTRALLELGHFPHDPTGRAWPWPVI